MLEGLLKIAQAIVGPEPGVKLLLFFTCGVLVWAYWKEKKKNDDTSIDRLREAREDTQAMTSALKESTATLKNFKESNEALRLAFEALTRALGKGA